jgi:flagellar motor switch protein FliN/FliY
MREDVISQEEIDALVRGATLAAQTPSVPYGFRLLVESAASALGDLIGIPCIATVEQAAETDVQTLSAGIVGEQVVGRAALAEAGKLYWVMPSALALAVITQLYGGVRPSALDDSALGALAEGLNQMARVGLERVGNALGRTIAVQPVECLPAAGLSEVFQGSAATPVWSVSFQLTLDGESGKAYCVLPQALGSLVAAALEPAPIPTSVSAAIPVLEEVKPAVATHATPTPTSNIAAAAVEPPVKPAQFPDLTPRQPREDLRNIDLLLDVSLQVTVELGRTRRQIRDVLALGPGSVLELDKLAGEQVDVLINGKLIAKGEVVVIDENYGVRITDIVSPTERVQSMR